MKRFCIFLSIVILLSGCSSPGSSESGANQTSPEVAQNSESVEAEFDLEAYREKVLELCDEIESSSIALGNMGKWESSFMQTLGRPSDDMIDRAFSWLEDNSDYTKEGVETSYDYILDLFSDLAAGTTGDDANAIFEKASLLHENYVALYCSVTTVPVSISEFDTALSESFSAVANGLTEIVAMVE